MILRELFVKLGANTDKASVDAFKNSMEEAKREARSLIRWMVGLTAAAGGAAAGIWRLVRQTADAADEAAKMGKRLGITAEEVQELDRVAKLGGTSMSELESGFRRMQREITDANEGKASSIELLDELGVQAHDTNGEMRSQADIFEDAVAGLAAIEDEALRSARAQDIFGRSGTAVLAMMERSGATFGEMREEIRAYGGVLSNETAAAFEEFNDNLFRGRLMLEGMRNTLAVALLPRVNDTAEGFLAWARAYQDLIRSRIEEFAERLSDILEDVVEFAVAVDETVHSWGGWEDLFKRIGQALAFIGIGKLLGKVASLGIAVKKAFAAMKVLAAVGAAALAKKIAIVAAIVGYFVALILIIQDLIVWIQGGDSAFGRLLERMGMAEEVEDLLDNVIGLLKSMWGVIRQAARAVSSVFVAAWRVMWSVVGPILRGVADLLVWLLRDLLLYYLNIGLERWTDIFSAIADFMEDFADEFELVMDAIGRAAENPGEVFREVWQRAIDWLLSQLDRVMEEIDGVVDSVTGIPGMGTAMSVGGGMASRFGPSFAPSSDSPHGVRNNSVNQSGNVNVEVDASGAPNAEEVGAHTAERTEQALWRVLRQTGAATAGGEL